MLHTFIKLFATIEHHRYFISHPKDSFSHTKFPFNNQNVRFFCDHHIVFRISESIMEEINSYAFNLIS